MTAIATSPYVMEPAPDGEGGREPPADGGAGQVRLLDRALWGRRELWARTAPSFVADRTLYEGLRYQPEAPTDLTRSEGPKVGAFIAAAKARGLEVFLQVQAAIPPGYRVQFGGPDRRRPAPAARRTAGAEPGRQERQPRQPAYQGLHGGPAPRLAQGLPGDRRLPHRLAGIPPVRLRLALPRFLAACHGGRPAARARRRGDASGHAVAPGMAGCRSGRGDAPEPPRPRLRSLSAASPARPSPGPLRYAAPQAPARGRAARSLPRGIARQRLSTGTAGLSRRPGRWSRASTMRRQPRSAMASA